MIMFRSRSWLFPSSGLLTALALVLAPMTSLHAASPAPVEGRNGMVVTAQHLATDIGVAVLKSGGNAVDAAVAVGYALAVTYPTMRQYRRRRLHDHSPQRWQHRFHRFP